MVSKRPATTSCLCSSSSSPWPYSVQRAKHSPRDKSSRVSERGQSAVQQRRHARRKSSMVVAQELLGSGADERTSKPSCPPRVRVESWSHAVTSLVLAGQQLFKIESNRRRSSSSQSCSANNSVAAAGRHCRQDGRRRVKSWRASRKAWLGRASHSEVANTEADSTSVPFTSYWHRKLSSKQAVSGALPKISPPLSKARSTRRLRQAPSYNSLQATGRQESSFVIHSKSHSSNGALLGAGGLLEVQGGEVERRRAPAP